MKRPPKETVIIVYDRPRPGYNEAFARWLRLPLDDEPPADTDAPGDEPKQTDERDEG